MNGSSSLSEYVNRRVRVGEGDFGTVRFHGQIDGKEWLGVEWDEPTRGKHNGTHKDTVYFHCRHPTSGSFVKPHSKHVTFGRSFVDAVVSKYAVNDCTLDTVDTFGDTNVKVEMYGFDKIAKKQSKMDRLEVVGLAELDISHSGDWGALELKRVTDLDLSRNLLGDWNEVGSICSHLSSLESLRLNFNRLQLFAGQIDGLLSFASIKTLSLQSCELVWPQVNEIVPFMHNLTHLFVGFNSISRINDVNVSHFQKLQVLNIESNKLCRWSDLSALARLPALKSLHVQNNQLHDLLYDDGFDSLEVLNISGNFYSLVGQMGALQDFPVLSDLRCTDLRNLRLPFSRDDEIEDILRIVMISSFSNLKTLNGSRVRTSERPDAELFYIKLCRAEIAQGVPETTFLRYRELLREYEISAELTQKELKTETLKDNLISVEFVYGDRTESKQLPRKTSLRVVRSMITRLFKILPTKQDITLCTGRIEIPNAEILDTRELSFYCNDEDMKLLFRVSKL